MQYPQDYLSIIYQRSRYYVDLTKEDWYCEELNQHILMLTQNGFAYALAIFEIEINMFCVNYDFDRIMVELIETIRKKYGGLRELRILNSPDILK